MYVYLYIVYVVHLSFIKYESGLMKPENHLWQSMDLKYLVIYGL